MMHPYHSWFRLAAPYLAIVFILMAAGARVTAAQATAIPKTIVSDHPESGSVLLAHDGKATPIIVDEADYAGVRLAAADLQADIGRVTGITPELALNADPANRIALVAGTLGHNKLIRQLIDSGKIKTDEIAGKWESFQIATVADPIPGVDQALVILGSDRRGTIYGIYEISQQIGVSPWYWWADVPVQHHDSLYVRRGTYVQGPPAVKYRGIFINDEDWGLHQWALKTFEPESKGIGPRTYAKVFELLLRLKLNYLWPAMHEVTPEFHSIPENVELADRRGIVVGASHCEPMLFNNVKWNERISGKWDYSVNRDKILSTWEESTKSRGDTEAVWTLGIRGIHDRAMQAPSGTATRIKIVSQVIQDQRALLDKYITKKWGPVAQCFVPYKEVLPLYDAGLVVPEDVTLVWVDDNFGYIRRLSSAQERSRAGGAGVYWHLSYYGGPHSYTWINTTAPALMWEELEKAWENDARALWVVNVGDIKPAEIGIDFFSRLAWNPPAIGPDAQPRFLEEFAAKQFGTEHAAHIADLLSSFYRLGTVRKPELMNRAWAMALPNDVAAELSRDYQSLLDHEDRLATSIPADFRDAYFEMIGFPARVLGASGLIFMADRALQLGDSSGHSEKEIKRLRDFLEQQVDHFNSATAGGKWAHMMPGLVTGRNLTAWSSQVRWPWGEAQGDPPAKPENVEQPALAWRDATSADRQSAAGEAQWLTVSGLGPTGHAMALKPASLESSWNENDRAAPTLEFNIETKAVGDSDLLIDFLPSFRICPGKLLRVAACLDDQAPLLVEVPGSSGKEDENGPNRKDGIQNNFVRARVPLTATSAGKHVLKIRAVDPGVVVERFALPAPK